jgi:hypothetical protein
MLSTYLNITLYLIRFERLSSNRQVRVDALPVPMEVLIGHFIRLAEEE